MTTSSGSPLVLHVHVNAAVMKAILHQFGVDGWNRWLLAMQDGSHFGGYWVEGESEPPVCFWINVGGDFGGCNLDGIMLWGIVSCDELRLDNGTAVGACFESCRGAIFLNANLQHATFHGDISGANFSGADLVGASFSEATYLSSDPPVGLPDNLLTQCSAVDRGGPGEAPEECGQEERNISVTATIAPSATTQ